MFLHKKRRDAVWKFANFSSEKTTSHHIRPFFPEIGGGGAVRPYKNVKGEEKQKKKKKKKRQGKKNRDKNGKKVWK